MSLHEYDTDPYPNLWYGKNPAPYHTGFTVPLEYQKGVRRILEKAELDEIALIHYDGTIVYTWELTDHWYFDSFSDACRQFGFEWRLFIVQSFVWKLFRWLAKRIVK